MATTKKLSFGLDKAGGAALILARIGAALLWIIAALAAVVWVVFLISPRSFAADIQVDTAEVRGERARGNEEYHPHHGRERCDDP